MIAALEVVVVPVSDATLPDGGRLVQLTPPGSASSITVGTITPAGQPVRMAPGSLHGLQLVVTALRAAHDELQARGVPNRGVGRRAAGRATGR